jgi:hypothetical protein
MAVHKSSNPPPGASASGTESNIAAAPAPAESPEAPGAVQANVPLFGPTTLSTTEPVMPAPAQFATMPGASSPSLGGAQFPPVEAVDDRKSSDDDGDSKSHKVTPFGHGKVSHATTLHMKTDGEITAIHGARTPTGFTVTLPGRRSMESGSALASHDTRIASVHVTNGSKGSELTFQFKDGVPSYLVRAKGHDLQIAIGRASDSDDATKDAPKRGATATKRPTETQHRSKKD